MRWPAAISASSSSAWSGDAGRYSATSHLLGDQQQPGVGLVDALVGNHQAGRHRVTQVPADAERRVVLEADDAADAHRALADARRLLAGGDLEVVEAQRRGHRLQALAVVGLVGLAELVQRA